MGWWTAGFTFQVCQRHLVPSKFFYEQRRVTSVTLPAGGFNGVAVATLFEVPAPAKVEAKQYHSIDQCY